jgi:protein SCO1/2
MHRATLGSQRNRLLMLLAAVALLVTGVIGTRAALVGTQPKLTGTDLGKEMAPNFHLRDAGGQGYSLDQFRGKVVVLAFLYTHCTDVCPLTAEILRHADDAAANRPDVVYLAVSVDPIGDTPESIATFNQTHHLDELGDRWHYLVGSLPELEAVWKSYYIYAPTGEDLPAGTNHTSGVFFVDKHGMRRVYASLPLRPEDVARNELLLVRQ